MAELTEIVERAVTDSFRRFLPDATYAIAGRDEGGPSRPDLVDGDDGAVAWVVRGTHTEHWPGIGSASGHEVVVKGVTFVSGIDQPEPDFFVVVDWADVLAQIGALVVDRPVELEEDVPTS